MAGSALDLTLALDVRSLPPGAPARAHLIAEVSAALPEEDRDERPPLALVFAVDVSASMAGAPIEHVVRSIERMVELLDPTDRVGVVVFSEGAEVVSELEPLDASVRRKLVSSLRRIDPEGATDIESGLRVSSASLSPRRPGERQGILLLSDGSPTRGEPRPEALADLAGAMRPDITVSTLGYGEEHNEDILRRIAVAGGGRYHYVRDPALCASDLARAVGEQGDALAEAVTLVLTPEPGVEIVRVASDVRVTISPEGARIELPDLLGGDRLPIVAEIAIANPVTADGSMPLVRAVLTHRRPGTAGEPHRSDRALAVDLVPGAAVPDVEARARVLIALADEARDEARKLADQQLFDRAAERLRRAVEVMRAEPQTEADPELAETIEQLAEEADVLASKPNPAAYRLFRKRQAALALSRRGDQMSLGGPLSRRAMAGIAGNLPPARLVMTGDGAGPQTVYRLDGQSITIGKTNLAQIRLDAEGVARQHCMIVGQDGKFYAKDPGGGSATLINGRPLAEPKPLVQGDVLRIGGIELRYEEEGDKRGGASPGGQRADGGPGTPKNSGERAG
ncbi:VWA domain-containing protein [Polyangium aurulentum]|uniref:VWA domain-containing protein n=1 Tax=Polyangium aurulentum TaxID=2567896 RepID=UPI00146E5F81|nr:VWA domain-containing protein [Polyangium aurulentum]UQA60829.1 VWA domain-containing protein [Polyangium aurulentum]